MTIQQKTALRSLAVGIVFGLAFALLLPSALLHGLLRPYIGEGFAAGYAGGAVILLVLAPAFVLSATLSSFAFSLKDHRLASAGWAFGSSALIVALALINAERGTKVPFVPPMILVANAIETGHAIEITVGVPFKVRAHVKSEKDSKTDLSTKPLEANMMVFVPGTTQRKILGTTTLQSTGVTTGTGYLVYEGSLTISESGGATQGFLSVIASPGVSGHETVLIHESNR